MFALLLMGMRKDILRFDLDVALNRATMEKFNEIKNNLKTLESHATLEDVPSNLELKTLSFSNTQILLKEIDSLANNVINNLSGISG